MSLVTDKEALKPVAALQEVRSSAIWKPDPVMQSNVELTNGRPDFEAILKDIQVSPFSNARSLACLHDWQVPTSLRGSHQACIADLTVGAEIVWAEYNAGGWKAS